MKVNKMVVPVLAIGILLGTVGIAQATGAWIVSGKQMIDVDQMASSAEIRGWMTLDELSQGLGIALPELYALTGIPPEVPPATALKDLEQVVPDFEVSSVRDAIGLYLGEGSAAAETEPTPTAIAPILAPVTPESIPSAAEELTVPTATVGAGSAEHAPSGDGTGPTPLAPGTRLAATEIKGRHTLQEIVASAEVSLPELLAALGLPPDTDPAQSVRDLVEAGLVSEVDTVRSAVNALQDGE